MADEIANEPGPESVPASPERGRTRRVLSRVAAGLEAGAEDLKGLIEDLQQEIDDLQQDIRNQADERQQYQDQLDDLADAGKDDDSNA